MAKNTPQTATSMKNRPSNLPGPNVMSLSSVSIPCFSVLLSRRYCRRGSLRRVHLHELLQPGQKVYWHREDDGGVLFNADLRQRLQIAQLNTGWFRGQQMGRVSQPLCCRIFAFRMDDLRPLFALGLGLFGHG